MDEVQREDDKEWEDHNPHEGVQAHDDLKFIIFKSSLQKLLTWCHCPNCGSYDFDTSTTTTGTLLCVLFVCTSCRQTSTWYSQSFIGDKPAGNLLLSAAVLYAGATITKVLRVFHHYKLQVFDCRTFFRHQKEILFPAIRRTWAFEQSCLTDLRKSMGDMLIVGGDGRADSRGHSAKFGVYTLMDLPHSCILVFSIVQVKHNFLLFLFWKIIISLCVHLATFILNTRYFFYTRN